MKILLKIKASLASAEVSAVAVANQNTNNINHTD